MGDKLKFFLPFILPKNDDSKLLDALFDIRNIHCRHSGVLGINRNARKIYNQKPFSISKKIIYLNNFNDRIGAGNLMEKIRNYLASDLNAFAVLIEDSDFRVYDAFYIPIGYPNDPYIRFLEL